MTEVLAVTGGLAVISWLFFYTSFSLKDSSLTVVQNISVFLSFMGLIFMDLLMFTIFRITQETAALNYLTSSIMITGLRIMTWVSVLLAFALFLVLVIQMILAVQGWYKETVSRRRWET